MTRRHLPGRPQDRDEHRDLGRRPGQRPGADLRPQQARGRAADRARGVRHAELRSHRHRQAAGDRPDCRTSRSPPRRTTAASRSCAAGYNYTDGINQFGQLDAGLLFVAYLNDPAHFIRLQTKLGSSDLLNEYISHVGFGPLRGAADPGARPLHRRASLPLISRFGRGSEQGGFGRLVWPSASPAREGAGSVFGRFRSSEPGPGLDAMTMPGPPGHGKALDRGRQPGYWAPRRQPARRGIVKALDRGRPAPGTEAPVDPPHQTGHRHSALQCTDPSP